MAEESKQFVSLEKVIAEHKLKTVYLPENADAINLFHVSFDLIKCFVENPIIYQSHHIC